MNSVVQARARAACVWADSHDVPDESGALEEPDGPALLDGADGILVPGGFGNRGTRGMMIAARVARERGIPYFGICYGFQWATVEYARNVAGLPEADSTECNPETPAKVIYKLRDLLGVDEIHVADARRQQSFQRGDGEDFLQAVRYAR